MFAMTTEQIRQERLWLIALQVFALSSFAISQPLYDLLGGTPDFFVANGASANSLLVAVLLMALGIPAVLVGILTLARMFGFRFGHCCYLIVVAALITLILLPPLNRSGMLAGWGAVAVAVVLGSAVAMMFHALPRVRLFAAVLSPAGILFAAVFLFWTDVAKIIFPREVEIEAKTVGDDNSLEGLSIIRQAITADGQITYGAPDPSGTLTASPPPLSPGVEYSWFVLNNYGNNPAMTAIEIKLPQSFSLEGDTMVIGDEVKNNVRC